MQLICMAGVFAGAVILVLSIIRYYRFLVSFRSAISGEKIFSRWIYGLCMVLMFFFLFGYLTLGTVYLTTGIKGTQDLLVSCIFFFGSIFVFVVVNVQYQMYQTISGRTEEIILALVNAVEAKDRYTQGHSVHVASLTELFYEKLPDHIRHIINHRQLMDAALLHDVGKIGISDSVLNKPGRLTAEEYAIIQQHPLLGKQILSHTSYRNLGDIILCHHERVDGNGYYKIPPDEIPIESKIIAISDTFSALFSNRVYRPKMNYSEAMAVLREAAGTQLDQELVDIFCSLSEEEAINASQNVYDLIPMLSTDGFNSKRA